ncbi:FAD-dependent oxidoreductase [Rhodanobacter sp. AS-Z3]|uniref:carboxylate--amine ligase n=1 Tax=Rhodanobacter sp. AS-Z3 TaxID=3031330 RepID=UPI002478A55A|nr:FAD-dependent oxidoreductase [Rhodanobacter sp. AS-Z3]WEN15374.1 FAD-dependent oxidoreductase [Rhodanobacter sp. AS-Z3]
MAVNTPAVVLGAGINGVGVARSLASAGVPVWLLDSDARRPEMHTRAAKPVMVRSLHGETLVEELTYIATTHFAGTRPVLFLTQEESVKTVSHHRDQLSALYRFSLPTIGLVDALQHKEGFQRLAERLGSPIPPLVHVCSLADLPAIESLRYPVVIKPGVRHTEYSRQFKKAYRADSAEAAAELIRRILTVMSDVVVQEWIEGPDSSIYFCLQYVGRQGRVVASFTGQKIRSWPPQVGGTASCVSAPEVHEKLSAMTAEFFQAAGVIGMASMEYKRDVRTNEFLMVEPTVGRTDYQEEVATLNGVNLPYAAWCSELDHVVPEPVLNDRPVVWRVRSEDMQSAAAQGQSLMQGYPRGSRVTDALWRWEDPMPSLWENGRRVRDALHRRTSKMLGGSSIKGSKS